MPGPFSEVRADGGATEAETVGKEQERGGVVASQFVPGWNMLQLRRLRRDLAPLPGPLVLMGDLNMSGHRPSLVTGYHSLARAATFPSCAPTRQLDHTLLRGSLPPVREVGTPKLPLSDHRPLIVDLDAGQGDG